MDIRHKKARQLSRYDRIEMGKRDNDKDYIEIVNEAGIEVEFSCPTDLKRQLDRINPGKEIKIVYKGITQTMSNRPFKLFEVFEAVS